MRAAILDDYQRVALGMAQWESLLPCVEAQAFHDHVSDGDVLASRLASFDIVVAMRERTPFPRSLLHKLPKLKLLVSTGSRNAAIDLKAASDLGIVVCGTNALVYPTAELTWGLILSLLRRIPEEHANMRSGRWQSTLGTGVEGKMLGVMGLGRLGTRVAKIGLAFGMKVVAWSQNLTSDRAREAGVDAVSKDKVLSSSDVLTIHLQLSERTRGLVGERELALMKQSALLVNTSRGPIVDERALIAALQKGQLGGAALDVYDQEPLPADHPLRRLANTVLTPHVGYVTSETYRIFYNDAVEDIKAFLEGKPVRVMNEDNAPNPVTSEGKTIWTIPT